MSVKKLDIKKMEPKKAELFPRFVAALIDGLIGWVFVVIPVLGGVISVLYLLFKDGIPFQVTGKEEWKNKSVGKKLMNLEVWNMDGKVVDLAISARRNVPLTVGSFIAIVPVVGWIFGPLVSAVFAIIELILLLTDKQGRRLGDRWANTQVMEMKSEPSDVDVSA